MSAQKRGRACEACSRIKIRCDLGATPDATPPCERCIRLNKNCVLSAPKRQKDRVQELEAQVQALTRLLQAQGIQDPDSLVESVSTPSSDSNPRKRRIIQDASPASSSQPTTTYQTPSSTTELPPMSLDLLDENVPYDVQQQMLDRYTNEQVPALPLVPLPNGTTLDSLRSGKPMLLYAVMYAAGQGLLDVEKQELVARPLLDRLVKCGTLREGMGVAASSLMEILQSMQISSLWYRSPKRIHDPLNVFTLIASASELASRLAIEDEPSQCIEGVDSADTWRSRLVTHFLASAMSIFLRKASVVEWTHDHDLCLLQLQYSVLAKPTDPWLSQLIRAERLCEQIAQQMDLFNTDAYLDMADPRMKLKVQNCRNKILNWRMTVPRVLRTPILLFWEHLATVYMHEPVLHTLTNGKSFCAPYIAEHLSVTDFPAPLIVTEEHITAVFELTASAQAMLDIFMTLDTRTMLALPGLLFAPRAAYALFVLAKLYIATSAPGSTLGVALDSSMLLVSEYADKMLASGKACRDVDERCVPARILFAAVSIKEWHANFSSIMATSTPEAPGAARLQPLSTYQPPLDFSQLPAPTDTPLDQTINDWDVYLQNGDSGDFGFDMMFAGTTFYEEMYNNEALDPYQQQSLK